MWGGGGEGRGGNGRKGEGRGENEQSSRGGEGKETAPARRRLSGEEGRKQQRRKEELTVVMRPSLMPKLSSITLMACGGGKPGVEAPRRSPPTHPSSAQPTPNPPTLVPMQVLSVQATTTIVMAHFVVLIFFNWLSIALGAPPGHPAAAAAGGGGSRPLRPPRRRCRRATHEQPHRAWQPTQCVPPGGGTPTLQRPFTR